MIFIRASKDTPIHMEILFNVLMGLRRQEINAVKYSDLDYINRTLSVERQLGKKLNREPNGVEEKLTTKSELPLKTSSTRRNCQSQIMFSRRLWKNGGDMRRTGEEGVRNSLIWAISAALIMANLAVRTFTGRITRNYCVIQDCRIFVGMI